jgi:hypothetical protein
MMASGLGAIRSSRPAVCLASASLNIVIAILAVIAAVVLRPQLAPIVLIQTILVSVVTLVAAILSISPSTLEYAEICGSIAVFLGVAVIVIKILVVVIEHTPAIRQRAKRELETYRNKLMTTQFIRTSDIDTKLMNDDSTELMTNITKPMADIVADTLVHDVSAETVKSDVKVECNDTHIDDKRLKRAALLNRLMDSDDDSEETVMRIDNPLEDTAPIDEMHILMTRNERLRREGIEL